MNCSSHSRVLDRLPTGGSLTDISGIALGFFAIGGGVLGYFRPDHLPGGTECAPYLYVSSACYAEGVDSGSLPRGRTRLLTEPCRRGRRTFCAAIFLEADNFVVGQ